jgi:hypothetical protein
LYRARCLVWAASAIAALLAPPAWAQTAEPATTAPASGDVVSTAPAKAPSQPSTEAQIADWIKGAPPLNGSDDGDDGVIHVEPNRGVHGEVGAFVSNHGYGGYVATTMPVGKDGSLGLAVGDEHYSGRYFRGDSQSLDARLTLGPGAHHQADCPGGIQVGDHYVEPLWATQMRGAAASPGGPAACSVPAAATAR